MINDIELIRRLNKDWRPEKIRVKKAGGQTNRNYIVYHESKKYFVRLPWERADIVDRKIEAGNISALSHDKKISEILPRYYLYIYRGKNILQPKSQEVFNLPNGTMVTEYIPGRLFKISDFKKRKYQEKLAQMFYIFHNSGVRFVNKYNVFRDEIKKYKTAAQQHFPPSFIDKKTILELERIEKEAKIKIPFTKKGVPTHNDFIFQNFIIGKNGKIYLLDFEYAGMNEKGGALYDFAFLFADNFFRKPPISQDLFEKFLGVADKVYKRRLDRVKIYWLIAVVPVMQVWWGLLRYFSVETQKEKKYFKNYIQKRAQGILKLYQFFKQKGVRKS